MELSELSHTISFSVTFKGAILSPIFAVASAAVPDPITRFTASFTSVSFFPYTASILNSSTGIISLLSFLFSSSILTQISFSISDAFTNTSVFPNIPFEKNRILLSTISYPKSSSSFISTENSLFVASDGSILTINSCFSPLS